MIRHATRPLTGPLGGTSIKLGRRPGKPGDTDTRMRFGRMESGEVSREVVTVPAEHQGQPAVALDGGPGRSGTRVFEDPAELLALAGELREAADWLMTEQMFGPQEGDTAQ